MFSREQAEKPLLSGDLGSQPDCDKMAFVDRPPGEYRMKEKDSMPAARITPKEAYEKVMAGRALLVCGYEDEEKFGALRLEGAVSFAEFQKMLPTLPKDKESVFYCA